MTFCEREAPSTTKLRETEIREIHTARFFLPPPVRPTFSWQFSHPWMRIVGPIRAAAVALMCSASPRASIPRATGSAAAAGGVHSLLKTIDNSLKADLNGDAKSDYPNQETREVIDAHWVEVCPD